MAVAAQHDAHRVESITLCIGPLSGVEPALLRTVYPIASTGTPADGAILNIQSPPLRVRCDQCGAETEATPARLICGACGDWRTRLISGDELLLTSVELRPHEQP